MTFVAAAGRFDDIIVAASTRSSGDIELWTWINGRFMEPLPVPELARVRTCAPLSETSWLFAAETQDGAGVLLEYLPLGHRCRVLYRTSGRSVLAIASRLERGTILTAGAGGFVAQLTRGQIHEAPLGADLEISAVAIDLLGRQWAATPGAIWTHADTWQKAWQDETWTSPFVGMTADVGRVVAVTSDGGVVQAEQPRQRQRHVS